MQNIFSFLGSSFEDVYMIVLEKQPGQIKTPREDYKNTHFCHLTPDTAFEKYIGTIVFFSMSKRVGRKKDGTAVFFFPPLVAEISAAGEAGNIFPPPENFRHWEKNFPPPRKIFQNKKKFRFQMWSDLKIL